MKAGEERTGEHAADEDGLGADARRGNVKRQETSNNEETLTRNRQKSTINKESLIDEETITKERQKSIVNKESLKEIKRSQGSVKRRRTVNKGIVKNQSLTRNR